MSRLIVLLFCALCVVGCDFDHKKKCEWKMVPDIDRKEDDSIDEGYIPVCARNYITKKQDCRLQATLEYAQENYGKVFRYVDLKIKSVALPRTVTQIDFDRCKEENANLNSK